MVSGHHRPRPGCCVAHEIPPTNGCRHCGHTPARHAVQRSANPDIGAHYWTPPTDEQRATRAALRARHRPA